MSTELEEKIAASLVDDRLPCSVAFDVAREVKVSRQQVGDEANRLKIRVVGCQLGCFDNKMATHGDLANKQIDRAVLDEVGVSLVDGYLPCPVAFKVAETVQVTPREVGDAATIQKIRINKCQLGCFP